VLLLGRVVQVEALQVLQVQQELKQHLERLHGCVRVVVMVEVLRAVQHRLDMRQEV
jgi:hypothetical protein